MIRLGNIIYSNCYPVHARLLEEGGAPGIALVDGRQHELGRLERREPLVALDALPPPPDDEVLGRPRVDDPRVFVAAVRAAHQPTRLSG